MKAPFVKSCLLFLLVFGAGWFRPSWRLDRGSVIVVLNNTPQPETVEFEVAPARLVNGTILEGRLGTGSDVRIEGGRMRLRLPGRSAGIYTPKGSQDPFSPRK